MTAPHELRSSARAERAQTTDVRGRGVVERRTYCRICPAQCGLVVRLDGERVVEVRGDPDHPVSHGYTCPKGRAAGEVHHHPRRLDAPRIRGRAAPWDHVLGDLASSLLRIVAESGPDAVAVYHGTWSWMDAPGRSAVEALVRHLGTRSRYSAVSVDAIARLVVSELLTGGPGLLPAIDVDEPGLTVLIGSNPVVSHGHASALIDPVRVLRRIARDHGLWVVDPRRTATAALASRHLAIRPGTDPALLAHLVREQLLDGADHEYLARHTDPAAVRALGDAVAPFDRAATAARTGLPARDLDELVGAIRERRRVCVLTGTGTTMAAPAALTEWLATAVHVVTGSLEAPGGPWCNPGLLSRADRAPVQRVPATPRPGATSRPDLPVHIGERPCAALADEIEAGNVRALLVLGGDPLTSLPDAGRLARAFGGLEVLAVADVLESATVAAATHVLAVAGMLERADCTWYTDRFAPAMVAQRTDAVVPPALERRTVADLAADLCARVGAPAPRPLLERVAERLPDLAQAGVAAAEQARPRGWFHERGLAGGRWELAPPVLVERLGRHLTGPGAEPLVLLPRRTRHRMNSLLRDIGAGSDDRELWIHPDDATRHGLQHGDDVCVAGPSGDEIVACVRVTEAITPGAVSLPHGLDDVNVNRLTTGRPGHVDPLTGMVTQSGLVVRLRRV